MTEIPGSGGQDIRALRRAEFGRQLRNPVIVLITVVLVAVGAFLGWTVGPLFALIGALVFLSMMALIALALARAKAAQAFFVSYAEARGLTRAESGEILRSVPIARKGHRREFPEVFSGKIEPGLDGYLALYTYYTYSSSEDSGDQDHKFTVLATEIPGTREWMPELLVWKKSGFRILEKVEDAFRRDHQRVKLENPGMADRYEVFIGKDQDPIRAFELFSPDLIGLLTGPAPKGYAFELVAGQFCAYIPKHRSDAGEIDQLVTTSAGVVEHIRSQAPD